MLVHQIFLHASLLVWGKKVQKKGSRDAVNELTMDLCLLQGLGEGAQPVAAEVFVLRKCHWPRQPKQGLPSLWASYLTSLLHPVLLSL